ncbi:MAG TPA: nicotinate-nucleotide adenylyltransferase [Acidimicrobiales bacterium]|nr:nicotinate-nucleotide adenylyltransferase [Acidimicrobiales bacterium]
MRVGVVGGTFDPVHIGHLAVAVAARHELALDRVLLMVANIPWQKADTRAITPAEDRFAMVAAAAADIDGVEASRMEIDRGGPSYTVETLEALAGNDVFLVLGAEAAANLHTWVRADEVPTLAELVVVPRPGVANPPGLRTLDVPRLDVTSTELRARMAEGRPVDVLVPPAALRVIRERGLYAD